MSLGNGRHVEGRFGMLNVQHKGRKLGVEITETREEVGVPRRDSELFASTRCRVRVVAGVAFGVEKFHAALSTRYWGWRLDTNSMCSTASRCSMGKTNGRNPALK